MKNHFKSIIVLCFITLLSIDANAQVFKHGVGAQLDIFSFKDSYTDGSGLNHPVSVSPIPGLVYKATLSMYVSKTRHLHISLATYPFIGHYANTTDASRLVAEIPLLVEFYYGDIDYFGAFAGIGAAYSYSAIPNFGDGTIIGPQIEGGVQFPFAGQVIAAKLAYTYGLNDPGATVFPERTYSKSDRGIFSMGLIYVFGG
ncbi:MAG: hypothetical protein GQ574_18110 [Crocinitomix sp.]|nr:hypothetical protein [Crocinitomix sp.]